MYPKTVVNFKMKKKTYMKKQAKFCSPFSRKEAQPYHNSLFN